jgi:hypothetical protein
MYTDLWRRVKLEHVAADGLDEGESAFLPLVLAAVELLAEHVVDDALLAALDHDFGEAAAATATAGGRLGVVVALEETQPLEGEAAQEGGARRAAPARATPGGGPGVVQLRFGLLDERVDEAAHDVARRRPPLEPAHGLGQLGGGRARLPLAHRGPRLIGPMAAHGPPPQPSGRCCRPSVSRPVSRLARTDTPTRTISFSYTTRTTTVFFHSHSHFTQQQHAPPPAHLDCCARTPPAGSTAQSAFLPIFSANRVLGGLFVHR